MRPLDPATIPAEIFACATRVEQYMALNYPGPWALGGIQRRVFTQQPPAEGQGGGEDREPDDGKVICPACCHQFRAIPVQVQRDMIAAGFEPPFTAPPSAPEAQGGGEFDYIDIANRAQEITGRSIWPSTAKAVLKAALAQQPAAAPFVCTGDEIRCYDGNGCECAMQGKQPPADPLTATKGPKT